MINTTLPQFRINPMPEEFYNKISIIQVVDNVVNLFIYAGGNCRNLHISTLIIKLKCKNF